MAFQTKMTCTGARNSAPSTACQWRPQRRGARRVLIRMRQEVLLLPLFLLVACEPDTTFSSPVDAAEVEPEPSEPEAPTEEEVEELDEPSAEGARLAWPQGVVPYEIDESVLVAQGTIEAAVRVLESSTRVRWVPHHGEADYVVFTRNRNPSVSRSAIGRQGGFQYIALGNAGLRRVNVVLHEMGHAMGRFHEHQRPDRDQYIIVHLENAAPSKVRNLEIRPAPQLYSLRAYDDVSIMHYSSHDFSNNGEPTMTRLDGSLIEGMSQGLTDTDVATFNEIVDRAQ